MVWFKVPVLVATNMVEHVRRSRLGHLTAGNCPKVSLKISSGVTLTIKTKCKLKLWSSAASLAALSYVTRLQYDIQTHYLPTLDRGDWADQSQTS